MNKIYILKYNPDINKNILRGLMLKFEEEVEFKRELKNSEKNKITESIDSLLFNFEKGNGICYVASWNDIPLGFLTLHHYKNNASNIIRAGDIEFAKAYLHPKARGKDIGYALNNKVITDLKSLKEEMDYKRIITTIEDTQRENIYLKTKKLGFREIANSMYIHPKSMRVYSSYAKPLR